MQRSRIAGIIASGVLLCGWSCSPGAADRPAESATASPPAATSPSATAEELADARRRRSAVAGRSRRRLCAARRAQHQSDRRPRRDGPAAHHPRADHLFEGELLRRQGRPRGLVYEAFQPFERRAEHGLQTKNMHVQVVFIPVAHDDLIPALLDGRGDIVAPGTLLTEWRREQRGLFRAHAAEFSSIVVSGPACRLDDTARSGQARNVSADIRRLGARRQPVPGDAHGRRRPPISLRAAPEVLADEDILEMVNAGLVPMTIVPDYPAEFWQQIFPRLVLNRSAAVKTDGARHADTEEQPALLAALNAFIARHPEDRRGATCCSRIPEEGEVGQERDGQRRA